MANQHTSSRMPRLLAAIQNAGREGISPRALRDIVWADDPEGGPLTADTCIRVMATVLRKRGLITSKGNTWQARYYACTVHGKHAA